MYLRIVFSLLTLGTVGAVLDAVRPPQNPCLYNLCMVRSTCIPKNSDPKGYVCECTNCYGGEFCDKAKVVANPCWGDGNHCLNGGYCDFTDCTLSCVCPPGFTGDVCQNEPPVNPCVSGEHQCQNGATCIPDKIGLGYFCQCTDCYEGKFCESSAEDVYNPCADINNSPCLFGGVCDFTDCTFRCICKPGYSGIVCENEPPVDACTSGKHNCPKGAKCVPDKLGPGYFCQCKSAKPVANPCSSDNSPCYNGGVCDFSGCTFSCRCPPNFIGELCQYPQCPKGVEVVSCLINPCVFATCPANQNAQCRANYCGGCNAVFYDSNGVEVDCVNPCDSGEHQCQNGATCVPDKLGLGYFCQCTNCYEGKFCESSAKEVYNPCADINNSPCLFGGACDFTDCTFRCICKPGYSGIVCENEPLVDACTSGEHNCPKGATCVPDKLGPGYFCQCESAKPVANPCSRDNSPCYNGGVCDFSGCTFSCRCPPNFIGELCQYPQCPKGVEVVSCLINPCVFATCPANQNAQCRANYCGGCNAVFYDSNGVEVDCDVHPCTSGEHKCQNGATCIPVGLGYSCECTNCFGGEFCQFAKPVANPCLRNNNPCYNGGTCDFPDCTLSCRCPPGFTGDLCQYVECPTSTPCLTAKCAHGFIVDKNGCQTCNCLPGPICKKIGCANPCPFGSETDANGCPTCKCLPNPAPCPNGKRPSRCKKNPCDGTTCEVNPMTACVPNYCGGCSADFYDHNLNIDQECLQANCPQIRCANPCPFGTEVTSEGCPTCRCLPNPAPCPNGRPPFACKRNPCDGTTCSVNPMTSCVPNYCGGCFVDFYDRNLNIDEECLETNCHGDLVFSDCASACPPTCKNPDIVCKALCRPGCTCPKGKVLTRLYSKRCVRPSSCKCLGLKGYLGECRIATTDEQ